MNRLIQLITHRPKTTFVIMLLLSLPFLYGFFHKTYLNHVGLYFDPDDPSMKIYERFQKTYGNEEMAIIGLHADDLFTNNNLDIIRQISSLAKSTQGIERVFSLTEATIPVGRDDAIQFVHFVPESIPDLKTLQAVRHHALSNEILTQTLLSKTGTTTAILLELAPNATAEEKGEILNAIAQQAKKIAGQAVELHFSGVPYVEYEINALTQKDDRFFTPATLLVIFLLSAFLLKDISLALLCLLNIFFSLVFAVGIYVYAGNDFNIVTVVMPPILLAVAVADSIHMLTHFSYHSNDLGKSRLEATVETAKRLWLPCLFTSLTTGVGFLSFLTTSIHPVRTLGLYTFIGVMLAFAVTMTALPALLMIVKIKPKKKNPEPPGGSQSLSKFSLDRWIRFIGQTTIKHYKANALFFALIIIIAMVGASQIRYETNFANHLSESNPVKQGLNFIEKNLSGTVPIVLLIRANSEEKDFSHPASLKLIERIQSDIKEELKDSYTSFFSITDYMKELHRAFNQGQDDFYAIPDRQSDILDYYEIGEPEVLDRIVSPDRMEARISFNAYLGPMDESKQLDHYLRSYVQKIIGSQYSYEVTGTASLYVAMDRNLKKSQIRSFASAFVVIFIMMYFICRNWKLTLICMFPNLFPIICTFGLMGFLDIPLDVSTILIASVTIGIAVDDTIHFIVWYRRNRDMGMSLEAALLKTYQDTGKAIMVTSLLLSISFLIFVTGSVKPVQAFGMLAGMAMVFALIGDLFILPTLILIFRPASTKTKEGVGSAAEQATTLAN